MGRLRELDFLRGVAIILVLLRHIPLCDFTNNLGWIGVDLFFVLSGFLVSGLLFKEYMKFGDIKPLLFLVRRGFKIYPVYFIFYVFYLIPVLFINHDFNLRGFLSDMFFLQNYVLGWGYAYPASWSLAVEEHFYIGLTFVLWLILDRSKKNIVIPPDKKKYGLNFEKTLILVLISVLLMRIFSNIYFPHQQARNFTMTHLRIDSLLFGVLISYCCHFKKELVENWVKSNRNFLFLIIICGLIWTPFIDPMPSFFVKTIGFTLLYISFGSLLLIFLFQSGINVSLDKLFSARIVDVVSKIGFCSYSIYIIHTLVITCCNILLHDINLTVNRFTFLLIASVLSVTAGMLITYKVEKYFLIVRNKYFPSRV